MIEDKNVIDNIIITPCSGAEYNGELARQVAIKLSENSEISSISSMHCSTIFLKNILLKNDILVQITKEHLKSSFSVIIDGCRISCVKTIFNFLELEPDLVIYVDEVVPKQKLNINDQNQPPIFLQILVLLLIYFVFYQFVVKIIYTRNVTVEIIQSENSTDSSLRTDSSSDSSS